MPKVRKLTADEVQTIERKNKGQRKLVEEQYDAFLSEYAIGDYGEAELEDGEKRITVRNRLKSAASRREVGLEFRRTKGNTLRFRVTPAGEGDLEEDEDGEDGEDGEELAEVAAVSSDVAPEEPKRRGRRKK